jgi:hypothetical protein
MVEQLQAAEDAGERVWIIGHIPLGTADTVVDQVRFSAISLDVFVFSFQLRISSPLHTVELLRSSAAEIQEYHCGAVLWTYA